MPRGIGVKTVANYALSDMQTLALLLPPPGKRWTDSDWKVLNTMIANMTEALMYIRDK